MYVDSNLLVFVTRLAINVDIAYSVMEYEHVAYVIHLCVSFINCRMVLMELRGSHADHIQGGLIYDAFYYYYAISIFITCLHHAMLRIAV